MNKLLLLILVASAAGSGGLVAQTNSTTTARPANRYLFIVETSRPMQRRANGVLQAAQQLLDSSMGGQLQAGDSLGIWTFNDELHTGKFPLQKWAPYNQTNVTANAVNFLQGQAYAGTARIERAVPAMDAVVRNSRFITIVLLTSGMEKIQGTPFDARINEMFTRWRAQQQDIKMPFVTVLRAHGGQFTDCTVTPFPWRIDLPSLPPELKVPVVAKTTAAPPVKSAPVRSLIVSGKKPAPAHPTTPPQTNVVIAPAAAPMTAPELVEAKTEGAASSNAAPKTATATTQFESKPSFGTVAHTEDTPSETTTARTPSVEPSTRPQTLPLAASTDTPAALPPNPKPEAVSTPAETLTVTESATSRSAHVAPAKSAPIPTRSSSSIRILWVAVPGLVLAGALLWFLRTRSRASEQQISLITRSLHTSKGR